MNYALKISLIMFVCLVNTNKANKEKELILSQFTHELAPFVAIVEEIAQQRDDTYRALEDNLTMQDANAYLEKFNCFVKTSLETAYHDRTLLILNTLNNIQNDPVAIRNNISEFNWVWHAAQLLRNNYVQSNDQSNRTLTKNRNGRE